MTAPVMHPQFRTIDGLSIRYAESAPRDDHALLLCPWPESLLAFERIWPRLAEQAHLVAIDLPGFGHSERHQELLSPRAMGDFVLAVADAFGLEHPHVVGPDVGTDAALFAAASHPGRLRSLAVGSGATAFPLQLGGALRDWVEAPDLDPYRQLDPRQIVEGALGTIEGPPLPERVREDYIAAYAGDRFVESMRYVRAYPAELPVLGDLLPQIETPVLVLQGAHDTAVPAVNGEFLHDRLPKSRLEVLDAAHFSWEEAPDAYADSVLAWWGGR